MAIRIITDSGSDIPQGTRGITVLPLHITFQTDTYRDGIDIDHAAFYDRLTTEKELPTTSQIPPYEFSECFQQIVDDDDVGIVIPISSQLSGTCQSAMIAASEFDGRIQVVDSLNATVGQSVLVTYARDLAEQGHSMEEIVSELEKSRSQIHLIALLDTLDYLKKGGRINAAVALAGSLLSIKPVVAIKEGQVALVGQARGSKQGNNYLMKEVEATGGIDFTKPYFLGYTGNDRTLLDRYIRDSARLWETETSSDSLPIMSVGCAIGTHIGPGGIALAYIAKNS